MKTKVFYEKYMGHKLLAIYDVDESDEKTSKYSILKFGVKKSKVILEHLEEIKTLANSAAEK